jgi:hypothetical protein
VAKLPTYFCRWVALSKWREYTCRACHLWGSVPLQVDSWLTVYLCKLTAGWQCTSASWQLVDSVPLQVDSWLIVYLCKLTAGWQCTPVVRVWHLRRSLDDLQSLDRQLHTCVYDRKYSQLPVIPQLENISANGNSLQVGPPRIQPKNRKQHFTAVLYSLLLHLDSYISTLSNRRYCDFRYLSEIN